MSAFAFRTDYLLAVDFQTDEPNRNAASRPKVNHALNVDFFKRACLATKLSQWHERSKTNCLHIQFFAAKRIVLILA
jgi:hypothetical protein